ncbi:AtpZ/AtpI family protein [Anaerolineae bacterium CFX7]|nr:AtpZ/AtpI family protein [Anaerolineae bacterium CFX7]
MKQRETFQRVPIDWRFVGQLGITLFALTILPVIGGVLLDRLLHTSPVITLFMMLLGFTLGIFTIAKGVAARYARVTAQHSNPQQVGGDQC